MDLNGKEWGFFLFRVVMGVNLLVHGAVRLLGDYKGFVNYLDSQFEQTIIGGGLVIAFATVLPWIEAILGAFLLVGFQTKWSLVVTGLLVSILVFGMCVLQNWNVVGIQMIYAICVFLLLTNIESNCLSVDKKDV